jgi:hypothetical protein
VRWLLHDPGNKWMYPALVPAPFLLWGWDDLLVPSLSGDRSIGCYGFTCATAGEGPGLLDNPLGLKVEACLISD